MQKLVWVNLFLSISNFDAMFKMALLRAGVCISHFNTENTEYNKRREPSYIPITISIRVTDWLWVWHCKYPFLFFFFFFFDSDVPRSTSYRVYIFQLIPIAIVFYHVTDFNARFQLPNFSNRRKTFFFSKFYSRHYE